MGRWHNELYGDEIDPPMKNGENNLMTHQGDLWEIKKSMGPRHAQKATWRSCQKKWTNVERLVREGMKEQIRKFKGETLKENPKSYLDIP
jgi:hypothetical protein